MFSNSTIGLPLLKSCSSSLTSLNLPQYSLCSSLPSSHLSWFLCVGHPQSGQSYAGLTRSWCFSNEVGHKDTDFIRSAFSRRAGNGDSERGWKRSSCERRGAWGAAGAGFFFLKMEKNGRAWMWEWGRATGRQVGATESEGMRREEAMRVRLRDVAVIVRILGKGKVKKWLVEACTTGEVSKISREGGRERNAEKSQIIMWR